jgi:hypothetical protein
VQFLPGLERVWIFAPEFCSIIAIASDDHKDGKEHQVSTLPTTVVDYPKPALLPEEWTKGKARHLELREPEVLKKYLEENSFLIPLINEASAKLVEYFGAETPQQGNRSITALQIKDLQNPSFYRLKLDFLGSPNKAVDIGSDDAQRVLDNDTLKGHIQAGDLNY